MMLGLHSWLYALHRVAAAYIGVSTAFVYSCYDDKEEALEEHTEEELQSQLL
jgi:hypothetical protein